jgi:hypothetical protein
MFTIEYETENYIPISIEESLQWLINQSDMEENYVFESYRIIEEYVI